VADFPLVLHSNEQCGVFSLFFGGGGGFRLETTQVFELNLGADILSCTSGEDRHIYHDNRAVQHILPRRSQKSQSPKHCYLVYINTSSVMGDPTITTTTTTTTTKHEQNVCESSADAALPILSTDHL